MNVQCAPTQRDSKDHAKSFDRKQPSISPEWNLRYQHASMKRVAWSNLKQLQTGEIQLLGWVVKSIDDSKRNNLSRQVFFVVSYRYS